MKYTTEEARNYALSMVSDDPRCFCGFCKGLRLLLAALDNRDEIARQIEHGELTDINLVIDKLTAPLEVEEGTSAPEENPPVGFDDPRLPQSEDDFNAEYDMNEEGDK